MPLPVEIPCSLFLGANTELAPSDLPEGVSPDNQDMAYLPGNTFSRPCTSRLFPQQPNSGILGDVTYFKSFTLPTGGVVNLLLSENGFLYKEDVSNNPGVVTRIGIFAKGSFASSVTFAGREWICFHDGLHGTDIPVQFDGTKLDRVSQDGPAVGPTAVDSVNAGSIAAGKHGVVMMFLTDQGNLTRPSPPIFWTAAGSFKVSLSNVAIGPPNIVARVFAFTAAGGQNYFSIDQNLTIPTVVGATVLFNNTDTTVELDFPENTLLGATPIDVDGNNQFRVEVLTECAGVFAYASRMFWFGERSKIENMLNMGFEGGTAVGPSGNQYPAETIPLGWTYVANSGGVLLNGFNGGLADFGLSWRITGDGSGNNRGVLTQPCYQDAYGVPIVQPLKNYKFRLWAQTDNPSAQGNLIAQIVSNSTGFNAVATLTINTLGNSLGVFVEANFNQAMPAVIPNDMQLDVFASGQSAGQNIIIDEMRIIDTAQPFLGNIFRGSYINNPEAFDGVTGLIGSDQDPTQVMQLFEIRNTLHVLTGERIHQTNDNQLGEPATWSFLQIAQGVGGVSTRCLGSGEEWAMWYSTTGLRIYEGGFPYKISQEVESKFTAVNQAALSTVWLTVDLNLKRCYIGAPVGTATGPSQIYMMDYRENDTAGEIQSHSPIHISFTGKMIASDLGRKWSFWNLPSLCGNIVLRSGNVKQFVIGSGRGLAPAQAGQGIGFYANVYLFDPAKFTDDDYGQMFPYYTTYFFINHDMEMALQTGSHRKLCEYLTAFVTGVGNINITPLANNLTNAFPNLPAYPLSATQNFDLEWDVNIEGQRIAFKFFPTPLTGQTDVQFNLQKMVVSLKKAPWSPKRGSIA